MKKVIFGDYDSYLDFGLIRTGMTIGTPQPKTSSVEIEGADGELDLTEYFGDINYSNRSLSFEFQTAKTQEEFTELFTNILNALHGRKMNIKQSDDIDYYYIGRVNVNEWKSDKAIGKIVIDVVAEPYKYKTNPTIISRSIAGTTTQISCFNSRKRVIPTITVTGYASIVYRTYSDTGVLLKEVRLVAQSNSYPYTLKSSDILFKEGENILEVSMNGTITIEYQEGAL